MSQAFRAQTLLLGVARSAPVLVQCCVQTPTCSGVPTSWSPALL